MTKLWFQPINEDRLIDFYRDRWQERLQRPSVLYDFLVRPIFLEEARVMSRWEDDGGRVG